MLFNSYDFIFYFLLPLLTLFWLLPKRYALALLIAASLLFYAQWDTAHLVLLVSYVVMNYFISKRLLKHPDKKTLFGAVALNLTPLAFFKYSTFFALSNHSLVLPLAISFYTFQLIAYQVDIYKKRITDVTTGRYLFFILFFPQLIAGPIVHYGYVASQLKKGFLNTFDIKKLQRGAALFSLGLFSKVVLADSLSMEHYRNWLDVFSYSFMIYFDFSGYASMAIGLALMFGITLPENFNSPYKARNIVEFWRRWHITLSNFLRDHIYIPLGGSQRGVGTQVSALLATMLIGGLWHGAGWQFAVWGLMHGAALAAVHLFAFSFARPLSVIITFLYVSVLWVLFFSPSLGEALSLYKTLFSFEPFALDKTRLSLLVLSAAIAFFAPNVQSIADKSFAPYLSAAALFVSLKFMAAAPAMTFVYFNF